MSKTFSLQQMSKTSTIDANLISRQYKLNLMADFLRTKYEIPKLKQSEIANQLACSYSTLQRYRIDTNLLSRFRIQPNTTYKRTKKTSETNFDYNSHREHDLKRPLMTLNDLKLSQTNTKSNKRNKNVPKLGSVHDNIETNDHFSDEVLDNIDI